MEAAMVPMRWRWNRTIPSSFLLTLVFLGIVALVLRAELRARVDWPAVGLAIGIAAASIAGILGFLLPVGASVDDDGVHSRTSAAESSCCGPKSSSSRSVRTGRSAS